MGKLPRIEGVRMLWSCGHYDGPCNGVAEHEGKHYWFEMLGCIDDGPKDWWRFAKLRRAGLIGRRGQRAWVLYPLTTEDFAFENARQEVFRQKAGLHCDYVYGTDGIRRRAGPDIPLPQEEWSALCGYYHSFGGRPHYEHVNEYKSRPPIGYFI